MDQVSHFGYVAWVDLHDVRRVKWYMDIVFDTLEEIVKWVDKVTEAIGGHWYSDVYRIEGVSQTPILRRTKLDGVAMCGQTYPQLPEKACQALSGIWARLSPPAEEPEDIGVPPELEDDLSRRVREVGRRVAEESGRELQCAYGTDLRDDEHNTQPIARICLHSKSPYTTEQGVIPTNKRDMQAMDFLMAHEMTDGEGIVIAVLDTGCNRLHPCLSRAVEAVIDATGHGPKVADTNGHGTAVASQIVSNLPSSEPFGTARGVRVVPIRVLHPVEGWGTDAQIARGVDAAVAVGAHIINMSLGGESPMPLTEAAIRRAFHKNIYVVVAAGNGGTGRPNVSFPARYGEAIAVGSASEMRIASSFSQRGPGLDTYACGENQPVAVGLAGYGRWNGTSMAAPHVSASIALYLSFYKQEHGKFPESMLWVMAEATTSMPVHNAGGGAERPAGMIQAGKQIGTVAVPPPKPPKDPHHDDNVWTMQVTSQMIDWLDLLLARWKRGEVTKFVPPEPPTEEDL